MTDEIIRELAKLGVKMDIVCAEINDLKELNRNALERITILEERVKNLENWKKELSNYQKLKVRFVYDVRSAIAGGLAGGSIGALLAWLLRGWG